MCRWLILVWFAFFGAFTFAQVKPQPCGLKSCEKIQGARIDAAQKKIIFTVLKTDCNQISASLKPRFSDKGKVKPAIMPNHSYILDLISTKKYCPLEKGELVELAVDLPENLAGTVEIHYKNLLVSYRAKKPIVDEKLTVIDKSKVVRPAGQKGPAVESDDEGSPAEAME